MATQVQFRGGTTVEHSTFTGAAREITVDIDKDTVVVHDGATAGGHPLAKEDGSVFTNVDINSGTIDGTTIGASTPAVGNFTNVTVTGTVDGRDVAADGTKLDGIEAGADVTDTANVTAAGAAMTTGATMAGNLNFNDGIKAQFGASADLQIYHDGSNSAINEVGTGSLYLQATNLFLRDYATSQEYLTGVSGGAVTLHHSGNQKLATTSTGVDVTGTVTADGLTVAGNVSVDGGTIKLDGNYPTGTGNVALGDAALNGSITGNYNTAVGQVAGTALTSGTKNAFFGSYTADANTTGSSNTALGQAALSGNTTGSYNTAVGNDALIFNTTASNNTAVGYQAGYNNTTGSNSVFIGNNSGQSNTTGRNTFVGFSTGYANTTGTANVAIGGDTPPTYSTLRFNTTGTQNTAVGISALAYNTTANNNTAVGYQTAYNLNGGAEVVAVGRQALFSSTTGSENTALGSVSLYNNTTGNFNVAVGRLALYSNTTASLNTAVGYQAGYSSTGENNTFIGRYAGSNVTTGGKNTIVGGFDGNFGGLDIRTSSNNIVLSDGDGNPRIWVKNGYLKSSNNNTFDQSGQNRHEINQNADGEDTLVIINSASPAPYGAWIRFTGSSPNDTLRYFLNCQDSTASRLLIYSNGNVVNQNNSYGAISDVKLKENIVDSGSQWDDIKALRVRKYSMKADNLDAPNRLGVIAQEVEAAGMGGLVFESPDIDPDTKEDLGTVTKQVNYSILYMKAVKALQEAMERIETLEAKVTALEAK